MEMKKKSIGPEEIGLIAAFAAAVAVGTIFVNIPIGLGYLNFGEIIIYTAAFLFGGIVGGLAGGIGAAAADILLGWAYYAPITLIVKGLEGFVVGKVSGESLKSKGIALALGAPIMIIGYTLARAYLEGIPAAIFQELPIDIAQAAVGAAIAIPISKAVQSKIPELRQEPKSGEKEKTSKEKISKSSDILIILSLILSSLVILLLRISAL